MSEPPAAEGSMRNIRRSLARIVIEIVVAFIGVYAAFALSAYHESRDADARKRQVRLALSDEIADITRNTAMAAKGTGQALAYYDSAWKAGGRPLPQPMLEASRFDTHMWNATLQSGGLNLMDVPTFYRISGFYNELGMGFEQLNQLRTLSETVLLPNSEKGPDEFYEPHSTKVRPKYQWYFSGLKRLNAIATELTASGDTLVRTLR